MPDISKHIRELLQLHDCVIVPRLGGFVANYKSAEINKSNNSIVPPKKILSFNKSLIQADGLLNAFISKKFNIGYVDAGAIIDKFVKDLQKRLATGKRVVLDGIGTFYLSKDKILQFEPDSDTNHLLESFGLSDIQLNPIQTIGSGRFEKRERKELGGISFWKRPIVRVAAVGIPAIVALSLVPKSNWNDMKVQVSNLNPFEVVTEDVSKPISKPIEKDDIEEPASEQQPEDMDTELLIEESETSMVKLALDEKIEKKNALYYNENESESNLTFHLIAGSFLSRENALRLKKRLKEKGYESSIMEANGKFRVTFGAFTNRELANEQLEKIKKEYTDTSVWMLSI